MAINIAAIKKLREKTGISIADCRDALEEANGDFKKAEKILKTKGLEKAVEKAVRVAGAGLIETYVHAGGRVAAMVEVACETDFVARTDEFKNLSHELAMQVAAMDPKGVDALLKQDYIRDSSVKVEELVKHTIVKLGENIKVKRFIRFEQGE